MRGEQLPSALLMENKTDQTDAMDDFEAAPSRAHLLIPSYATGCVCKELLSLPDSRARWIAGAIGIVMNERGSNSQRCIGSGPENHPKGRASPDHPSQYTWTLGICFCRRRAIPRSVVNRSLFGSIVLVRFSKDGIWHVVDNAKKDISFLFNGQNTYKTNFNIHDRFSCLYTDGKSYTAQFFGNFVSIERAYAEIKNYEKLVGKSAEKMTKRKHNDTEGTRKEKQGAPSAAENSVRESIDRLAELTFAQRRHLFSKNKTNADGKVDGSAVPSESLDQQLLPNAISVFQLPVAGINVQSEEAALQQSSRTPTEAPDQIAVLGDMYPDEPDLDFSSPLGVKRKAPAKGVPYRPRPIFSGTLEERVAYLILKAERGKDSRQKNPPPYLVADYHVRFLDQTAPWFFMEDGPKKVQLLSGLPIYADDRLSDLDARYQEGKMSTPKYVWFVMQRLIGGEEGLRRLASLKEKEQHEIELTSMGKGSKFAERTLGAQVFLAVERHVDAVIKSSQRGGVHLVPVAYGSEMNVKLSHWMVHQKLRFRKEQAEN